MTTETSNSTPTTAETTSTETPEQGAVTPKPRRRRWFLRIAVSLVVLLVLTVILLPFILSMGFVRARIERTLTEQLGAKVTLQDHSVSWGSLELKNLDIRNPDGFPQDKSAVKVASVDGAVSLWSLMGGTVVFNGTIDGVEVRVFEKKDGTTNLQRIAEHASKKDGTEAEPDKKQDPDPAPKKSTTRDPHKLDLKLTNGLVEIEHEQHGIIEALRELTLTVKKIPGNDLKIDLTAKLQRPGDTTAGLLAILADYDISGAKPGRFSLLTTGLDLSRYQPLLSLLGEEGQRPLDSMSGKLEGKLEGTFHQDKQITLGGRMVIEQPAFKGQLGEEKTPFALQQARFVLEPNLVIPFENGTISPEKVDIGKFKIDLGLLRVQGLSADRAKGIAGGKEAIGFDLDADLTKIVAAIGPLLSDDLRKTRGKVAGLVSFAPDWSQKLNENLEKDGAKFLLANLFMTARVAIQHLDFQDYRLSNLESDLSVTAGKIDMKSKPGGTINGGPAALAMNGSLLDDRVPVNLHISWQKAQAKGDSVKLLRWAAPFLAGLDVNAPIDFSSLLDADLHFSGPAKPKEGQELLPWLNEWSGSGKIAMRDGSFTPAAQWKPLLEFLGQSKLSFNDVKSSFRLKEGGVHTEMMRFNDNAHSLGIRGSVKLDGSMDYKIDLSDVVKKRKDAAQIMKFIGDQPLEATLGGSLSDPKLKVPIGEMIQKALTQGLKKKVEDDAKKEINKGLNRLFKKRKKR